MATPETRVELPEEIYLQIFDFSNRRMQCRWSLASKYWTEIRKNNNRKLRCIITRSVAVPATSSDSSVLEDMNSLILRLKSSCGRRTVLEITTGQYSSYVVLAVVYREPTGADKLSISLQLHAINDPPNNINDLAHSYCGRKLDSVALFTCEPPFDPRYWRVVYLLSDEGYLIVMASKAAPGVPDRNDQRFIMVYAKQRDGRLCRFDTEALSEGNYPLPFVLNAPDAPYLPVTRGFDMTQSISLRFWAPNGHVASYDFAWYDQRTDVRCALYYGGNGLADLMGPYLIGVRTVEDTDAVLAVRYVEMSVDYRHVVRTWLLLLPADRHGFLRCYITLVSEILWVGVETTMPDDRVMHDLFRLSSCPTDEIQPYYECTVSAIYSEGGTLLEVL